MNNLTLAILSKQFSDTNEFEKRRAIRASVGSVGGVLARMTCQQGWRGWCACVGHVLAWLAWVACLRGWRASVLVWMVCLKV